MVGAITNLSLVDYPSLPAMVIFMKGCNLKCTYCHNMALARMPQVVESIEMRRVIHRMRKSKDLIDAVVITGGEPLHGEPPCSSFNEIQTIALEAHKLGLMVKLDTNGTYADRLSYVITRLHIDYVAMDIKTYPQAGQNRKGYEAKHWKQIISSLDVMENYRTSLDFQYEIRTTCHPLYVNERIIRAIARLIPDEVPYYLQPYQQVEGDNIQSTPEGALLPFLEIASSVHADTHIRGG